MTIKDRTNWLFSLQVYRETSERSDGRKGHKNTAIKPGGLIKKVSIWIDECDESDSHFRQ
jgi:hypothetical protein